MELFGKYVPEGFEVTGNSRIVNRDPKIYGEDADEFKPERWLNAEKAKEYNRYSLTFGFGPRVCLGREIVYMELYKAPLLFFRTFKPTLLDNGKYVYRGGIISFEDQMIRIEKRGGQ